MVNSGFKQSLYYGNETSYGSSATVDKEIGIVQSVNPTETNNIIKLRKLNSGRDYSNIIPGKFEVGGSFEYYMQYGHLLRQAFGEDTATTSATDSGPKYHTGSNRYLHVLGSAESPGMNNFPSFTLEFNDYEGDDELSNLKRVYAGTRIDNMRFDISVDDPLKVSVDWKSQNVAVSSAAPSSVSESTVDPYVFYQGAVYATSGSVSAYTQLDSDSIIAEVNSISFSIGNNLEAKWYVSGTTSGTQTLRGLKELIVKGRDYSGSLSLDFSSPTMYKRFLGSESATGPESSLSKYQIVLDFVRSGTIGGTKTETDDWLRLVLKNCAFASENIPGNINDVVTENIELSIESATAYVVDGISSY